MFHLTKHIDSDLKKKSESWIHISLSGFIEFTVTQFRLFVIENGSSSRKFVSNAVAELAVKYAHLPTGCYFSTFLLKLM